MTFCKSHALLIKQDAAVIINCKRERDKQGRNRKVLKDGSDIFVGQARTI